MYENDANDNNTILGVFKLSNGNVLDLAVGKCTCSSKANRHFIIYKVAKKNLTLQKSPSTSLLAAHGHVHVNNSSIFECK